MGVWCGPNRPSRQVRDVILDSRRIVTALLTIALHVYSIQKRSERQAGLQSRPASDQLFTIRSLVSVSSDIGNSCPVPWMA
jgi:hypothetical protein